MPGAHSCVLLLGMLASFCAQSEQSGGWTNLKHPDKPRLRARAEYAYREHYHCMCALEIHVTLAKKQIVSAIRYFLLFTAKCHHGKMEKCVALVRIPPVIKLQKREVSKFRCF
ncbi:uncharacterized protein LOC119165796 [Rhipicephalus microplus]|uniref:uncharacterized protein LOC119165796 n=1 Tax=Rhipicephalus microplus TaxID=6941 RepID=UPI003F6B8A03